jgi:hypothetical protein
MGKKGTKDIQNHQKNINKITGVVNYFSVITLNVNELNYPIKRHRVAEEIKNQKNLTIYCL